MKKVLCIAVGALLAISVAYGEENSEPGQIGVGYQGIFFGDLINALSIRMAPAPIGGQLEIGEGGGSLSTGGAAADTDFEIFMLKGKGYYTLIQRENSAFYAGASLGYYIISIDDPAGNFTTAGTTDVTGFSIAPLIGTEWNFQGLKELGFNFEISYEINNFDVDVPGTATDPDLGLRGITISTGVNYYF